MSEQSKFWCYTINNYRDNDCDAIDLWDTAYNVYGKEIGPATGTPHLQGYVIFKTNKRLAAVKKLNAYAHWEVAKGTPIQASDYCKKDKQFMECGALPASKGSGNKERWDLAKEAAKEGRLDDIPSEIFMRFYRTIKEIKKDYMVKPEALSGCCGLWIYGPSGTGKSHSVITQHPSRYIKPLNKWWDGYQGEDVVHIDELSPAHTQWIAPYLKQWSDKWPFAAETKGGTIQIRPKRIIITTNYSIESMLFAPEDLPAIERRFPQVLKSRSQDIIV